MRRPSPPLTLEEIPQRIRERFWRAVETTLERDVCWPHRNAPQSSGYSQVSWQDGGPPKRMLLAHRVAYVMAVGPIPEGYDVDHTCRLRICCRPSHLRLLPTSENRSDNGWAAGTRVA